MKSNPKFPKVMCTQHPDTVSRYISTQEEPGEAVEAVMEYGCDEYMPDYEGKTTPYHQNVQIISKFLEETDLIPGIDIFITPRAPSAVQENRFRQLMVMMSVAEANYNGHEHSGIQAISELVHPMTSSIQEIVESQQHMIDVTELAKKEFHFEMVAPRIIPLIEDVPGLLDAKTIIDNTILSYKEQLGEMPETYRVFMGKSDSALTFGHVASTLSCKYAIRDLHELQEVIDTDIGIIFGAGALPFRGHVTLENADNFFNEFRGIHTVTLQSGLRYDHEKGDAKEFVRRANDKLAKSPDRFSDDEKEELINIIGIFGTHYNKAIGQLSETINCIADFLPQQRDRLMRGGSTGYARDVPDVTGISCLCRHDISKELTASMSKNLNMPRAIKFTGALYSIGLPPEIIGTGLGLADVNAKLGEDAHERLLTRYFPTLRHDLAFAFGFLNMDVASRFLPDSLKKSIQTDIDILRDTFDLEIQCDPSYRILLEMAQPTLLYENAGRSAVDREIPLLMQPTLAKMGIMRKSLG